MVNRNYGIYGCLNNLNVFFSDFVRIIKRPADQKTRSARGVGLILQFLHFYLETHLEIHLVHKPFLEKNIYIFQQSAHILEKLPKKLLFINILPGPRKNSLSTQTASLDLIYYLDIVCLLQFRYRN